MSKSIILFLLLLPAIVLVDFAMLVVFPLVLSLFRLRVRFAFIMSLHLTINSSQSLIDKSSASVAAPVPQSTDVGESVASSQAGLSSAVSLPQEIVALIAQSVQAAMVAERAKTSSLPVMWCYWGVHDLNTNSKCCSAICR